MIDVNLNVTNRFQGIENSTLAKSELVVVEMQLDDLMERVNNIEQTLSSGAMLASRYSLVIGKLGLAAVSMNTIASYYTIIIVNV